MPFLHHKIKKKTEFSDSSSKISINEQCKRHLLRDGSYHINRNHHCHRHHHNQAVYDLLFEVCAIFMYSLPHLSPTYTVITIVRTFDLKKVMLVEMFLF